MLETAMADDNDTGLFCWVLIEVGCRISEALALTCRSIDVSHGAIIVECLKKRKKGVFRGIPVSDALIQSLNSHFRLRDRNSAECDERLWAWCRMTAYRYVTALMYKARIEGPHATPKGLRHGFGVAAVSAGIPLNLVQRWLGHADMRTTAIYANAGGDEERRIASRMWLESGDYAPPRVLAAAAQPTVREAPANCIRCPERSAWDRCAAALLCAQP